MIKKTDFYDFLKKIPKAELHLHIEAVISKETIKKLFFKKNNIEFTDRAMKSLFNYEDLNGFIAAYLQVQELFTSVDDFDLIFDDLKNYIIDNGLTYAEVFAAPSAFLKKGFSFSEMVKNYRNNIQKIKQETGVTVNLLIDVSRTFGEENAQKNLDLLLGNRIPEIIGIGLGGAEIKGPSRDFGHVFQRARDNKLLTVAHAGEDVGPESVWDAINVLHAQRIGHGISAKFDEKLMQYLAETQIPLEICPTSNVFTKKYVQTFEEHPVKTFFEKNILVTINTDDPLFFGVSLVDEYWKLYSKLHFKLNEIKQLILNGFTASFLTDEEKTSFKNKVEESWEKFSAEL